MDRIVLITEFSNQIRQLTEEIRVLSGNQDKLKTASYFDHVSIRTNILLLKVLDYIENDNNFLLNSNYFSNFFVKRWQHFKSLSKEVLALVIRVSRVAKLTCEEKEMYGQVLSLLSQKVDDLTQKIWTQGRLPIHYGNWCEEMKQVITNQMELRPANSKNLKAVDSYTFHLLASSETHFEGIETKELEGHNCSRALLNLIHLLQRDLQKEYSFVKQRLIEKLQGALTMALKIENAKISPSGIEDSNYIKGVEGVEPILAFLEERQGLAWDEQGLIIQESQMATLAPQNQKLLEEFLRHASNDAPREVILHDLCWDILRAIEQLSDGDYLFIPLGTPSHFVLARLEVIAVDGEKIYTWILYNTGEGLKAHHLFQIINQQLFVNPLKIGGIRKQDLCYSFWQELFTCELNETAMKSFYCIQKRYLIDQGHGYLIKSSQDFLYPVPDFGICTYSAAEMAVFNQLSSQEIKKFEKNKALFAIKKQSRVVKERSKALHRATSPRQIKLMQKKFKQSQRLLLLSYRLLDDLSKEQSLFKAKKSIKRFRLNLKN
jgi:hypothetical protein